MSKPIGTIHEKNSLFLRQSVGKAEHEGRHYEMDLNAFVTPMVTSKQTGKSWHLSWQAMIDLAIKEGVDAP